MFDTIVVGVDGREGGRDALVLAAALAGVGHGTVVTVRVYSSHARDAGDDAVLRRAAEAELARDLEQTAVAAEAFAVGDPSPARALHGIVEERHAELIVVGSPHRGPLGRLLVDDVTADVLHGAPCPVAVAPPGLWRRDVALDAIGVGVDGTEESRSALETAARVAERSGARLIVQAVVELPLDLPTDATFVEEVSERTRRDMSELTAEIVGERDIPTTVRTSVGEPGHELVLLSHDVGLLVIGSQRSGPLRRLMMGRTAERVVHHTACPVLVVPRPERAGPPASAAVSTAALV